LRVGLGNAPLSGGDVRPPLEELRGKSQRDGRFGRSGAMGIEKLEAGLPISAAGWRARAARGGPRMIRVLGDGRVQLRLVLGDVLVRPDASFVAESW